MLTWVDINEVATQQARTEKSEAERRRALVAFYYAYFHRLCHEAALPFAIGGPTLVAQVGRGLTHTGMRSVCEVYRRAGRGGGSLPTWFSIAIKPTSEEVVGIAETFVELQEARVSADYDLSATVSMLDCFETRLIADRGHAFIDKATGSPEMTVFLAALLLADRWTRRG